MHRSGKDPVRPSYGDVGGVVCHVRPGVAYPMRGSMSSVTSVPLAEQDLSALVDEWVDWHQAAELLGVPVSRVRTMIREHDLAAAVPSPGAGQRVPAAFIQDGLVVKGLSGLLTVLHDAGFDDRECIAWLFIDDDLPGRPIDALRENRGTEAKRRAQALGF